MTSRCLKDPHLYSFCTDIVISTISDRLTSGSETIAWWQNLTQNILKTRPSSKIMHLLPTILSCVAKSLMTCWNDVFLLAGLDIFKALLSIRIVQPFEAVQIAKFALRTSLTEDQSFNFRNILISVISSFSTFLNQTRFDISPQAGDQQTSLSPKTLFLEMLKSISLPETVDNDTVTETPHSSSSVIADVIQQHSTEFTLEEKKLLTEFELYALPIEQVTINEETPDFSIESQFETLKTIFQSLQQPVDGDDSDEIVEREYEIRNFVSSALSLCWKYSIFLATEPTNNDTCSILVSYLWKTRPDNLDNLDNLVTTNIIPNLIYVLSMVSSQLFLSFHCHFAPIIFCLFGYISQYPDRCKKRAIYAVQSHSQDNEFEIAPIMANILYNTHHKPELEEEEEENQPLISRAQLTAQIHKFFENDGTKDTESTQLFSVLAKYFPISYLSSLLVTIRSPWLVNDTENTTIHSPTLLVPTIHYLDIFSSRNNWNQFRFKYALKNTAKLSACWKTPRWDFSLINTNGIKIPVLPLWPLSLACWTICSLYPAAPFTFELHTRTLTLSIPKLSPKMEKDPKLSKETQFPINNPQFDALIPINKTNSIDFQLERLSFLSFPALCTSTDPNTPLEALNIVALLELSGLSALSNRAKLSGNQSDKVGIGDNTNHIHHVDSLVRKLSGAISNCVNLDFLKSAVTRSKQSSKLSKSLRTTLHRISISRKRFIEDYYKRIVDIQSDNALSSVQQIIKSYRTNTSFSSLATYIARSVEEQEAAIQFLYSSFHILVRETDILKPVNLTTDLSNNVQPHSQDFAHFALLFTLEDISIQDLCNTFSNLDNPQSILCSLGETISLLHYISAKLSIDSRVFASLDSGIKKRSKPIFDHLMPRIRNWIAKGTVTSEAEGLALLSYRINGFLVEIWDLQWPVVRVLSFASFDDSLQLLRLCVFNPWRTILANASLPNKSPSTESTSNEYFKFIPNNPSYSLYDLTLLLSTFFSIASSPSTDEHVHLMVDCLSHSNRSLSTHSASILPSHLKLFTFSQSTSAIVLLEQRFAKKSAKSGPHLDSLVSISRGLAAFVSNSCSIGDITSPVSAMSASVEYGNSSKHQSLLKNQPGSRKRGDLGAVRGKRSRSGSSEGSQNHPNSKDGVLSNIQDVPVHYKITLNLFKYTLKFASVYVNNIQHQNKNTSKSSKHSKSSKKSKSSDTLQKTNSTLNQQSTDSYTEILTNLFSSLTTLYTITCPLLVSQLSSLTGQLYTLLELTEHLPSEPTICILSLISITVSSLGRFLTRQYLKFFVFLFQPHFLYSTKVLRALERCLSNIVLYSSPSTIVDGYIGMGLSHIWKNILKTDNRSQPNPQLNNWSLLMVLHTWILRKIIIKMKKHFIPHFSLFTGYLLQLLSHRMYFPLNYTYISSLSESAAIDTAFNVLDVSTKSAFPLSLFTNGRVTKNDVIHRKSGHTFARIDLESFAIQTSLTALYFASPRLFYSFWTQLTKWGTQSIEEEHGYTDPNGVSESQLGTRLFKDDLFKIPKSALIIYEQNGNVNQESNTVLKPSDPPKLKLKRRRPSAISDRQTQQSDSDSDSSASEFETSDSDSALSPSLNESVSVDEGDTLVNDSDDDSVSIMTSQMHFNVFRLITLFRIGTAYLSCFGRFFRDFSASLLQPCVYLWDLPDPTYPTSAVAIDLTHMMSTIKPNHQENILFSVFKLHTSKDSYFVGSSHYQIIYSDLLQTSYHFATNLLNTESKIRRLNSNLNFEDEEMAVDYLEPLFSETENITGFIKPLLSQQENRSICTHPPSNTLQILTKLRSVNKSGISAKNSNSRAAVGKSKTQKEGVYSSSQGQNLLFIKRKHSLEHCISAAKSALPEDESLFE